MLKRTALFAMLAVYVIMFASCAGIMKSNHPDTDGWKELFKPDLSNAYFKEGSWTLDNGLLTRMGGGDIWTREHYGDFILDLEFKVAKGSNSGVFLRSGDYTDFIDTTIEIQVHDTTDGGLHGMCGAVYDCLSPSRTVTRKTGEWNRYTITCKANKIYIVLNGVRIINMDMNDWTEAHKNPDGTPNKFNTAYKYMPRVGNIGFQDHNDPVWFRNIKIKEL